MRSAYPISGTRPMVTGRSMRRESSIIELRTYVFIDSLQPQLAELMASVSQGFPPVPGDSCLWVEVAPGMAVHRVTDIALKATQVKLTQQVVERAFGSMVVHSRSQADVRQAGEVLLSSLGTQLDERDECRIEWQEIIRGMTADHAVLINRQHRGGSMMIPGESMFILETQPAGYIVYAANQAEKAASIKLVDCRAVGAYGRLTLAGSEADIEEAAAAAIAAMRNPPGT